MESLRFFEPAAANTSWSLIQADAGVVQGVDGCACDKMQVAFQIYPFQHMVEEAGNIVAGTISTHVFFGCDKHILGK